MAIFPTTAIHSRYYQTGNRGVTLTGASGNDYFVSWGQATLIGRKGDDRYDIGPDNRVIEQAGEGIDTVLAGTSSGYKLPDNIENANLSWASAPAWLEGNDLVNRLTGNNASNTLIGQGSDDLLSGGGGKDIFVIADGDGNDVISDFVTSGKDYDRIRLDGFDTSFAGFDALKPHITQFDNDAVVKLAANQSITLYNVDASRLTADNFSFGISKAGMVQTFNDDFENLSLLGVEGGTWSTMYPVGGNRNYTLGDEITVYTSPNFRGIDKKATHTLAVSPFTISDGTLTITAEKAPAELLPYLKGYDWDIGMVKSYEYVSGMINTNATFAQTYGYFEMTAELPSVDGAWSAFWMDRVNGVWPPELDIVEYLGREADQAHGTVHTDPAHRQDGMVEWVPNLAAGMHTYAAAWTPYEITMYIDGKITARMATPVDMHSAMYLIANLALGGAWAGPVDLEGGPIQMKIDSIKAYQFSDYTLENYTLKTSSTPTHYINGTEAAETLKGTATADRLIGNGGADTLIGSDGDDTYIVSDSETMIHEVAGEGVDTVISSVRYKLNDGAENLTLTGTANIKATGNQGANILTGNDGSNVLDGGQGSDVLTGGAGADTFVIGNHAGSDVITDFGTRSGDQVRLDVGLGFMSIEDVRAAMTQHGADVFMKLSDYETLVFRGHQVADFSADHFVFPTAPAVSGPVSIWHEGTAWTGADPWQLIGTSENDHYNGLAANDTVVGGGGDDSYVVGYETTKIIEAAYEGIDTITTWLWRYTLPENIENFILAGEASGTISTGNAGNNTIFGNDRHNILNGKQGTDFLTGGGGNDTFVFEKGTGHDTVTDFSRYTLVSAEHDLLKFVGYGFGATLTHNGNGLWSIHYDGGTDQITLMHIDELSAKDYLFV